MCAFTLAALLGWGAALYGPSAARADASPIGAHSMLQLNAPLPFKERMFAEAAAMHASAIRLDVQPSMVFTDPLGPPDFTGLDEVVALSQRYHLRVVADLLSIPWWIASCGQSIAWTAVPRCATDDLPDYESMLAEIVTRADPVIRDWEIWNEPDQGDFFSGTPQQYARMLRAAHDTIKQIDPQANVLLGGISDAAGMAWLAQVFATPDADAAHAFDIANVHERARLSALAPDLAAWRKFLASYGFDGPLWVTEHGYPSDPAYQYDPAYADGEFSQAAYLTASIPTLLDAGASEVFVTERDNLGGPFASEGILGGDVEDPPVADPLVIEKPSYDAVSALAQCYAVLGRDCRGPLPVAAPAGLALPPTLVGSTTTSTLSVANPGSEPLLLGQASLASPAQADGLGLAGDTCSGRILEPAQSCTVAVRYAPMDRRRGERNSAGALRRRDADDDGERTRAIGLGAQLVEDGISGHRSLRSRRPGPAAHGPGQQSARRRGPRRGRAADARARTRFRAECRRMRARRIGPRLELPDRRAVHAALAREGRGHAHAAREGRRAADLPVRGGLRAAGHHAARPLAQARPGRHRSAGGGALDAVAGARPGRRAHRDDRGRAGDPGDGALGGAPHAPSRAAPGSLPAQRVGAQRARRRHAAGRLAHGGAVSW